MGKLEANPIMVNKKRSPIGDLYEM